MEAQDACNDWVVVDGGGRRKPEPSRSSGPRSPRKATYERSGPRHTDAGGDEAAVATSPSAPRAGASWKTNSATSAFVQPRHSPSSAAGVTSSDIVPAASVSADASAPKADRPVVVLLAAVSPLVSKASASGSWAKKAAVTTAALPVAIAARAPATSAAVSPDALSVPVSAAALNSTSASVEIQLARTEILAFAGLASSDSKPAVAVHLEAAISSPAVSPPAASVPGKKSVAAPPASPWKDAIMKGTKAPAAAAATDAKTAAPAAAAAAGAASSSSTAASAVGAGRDLSAAAAAAVTSTSSHPRDLWDVPDPAGSAVDPLSVGGSGALGLGLGSGSSPGGAAYAAMVAAAATSQPPPAAVSRPGGIGSSKPLKFNPFVAEFVPGSSSAGGGAAQ